MEKSKLVLVLGALYTVSHYPAHLGAGKVEVLTLARSCSAGRTRGPDLKG